jgi:hypothetical protein
VRSRAACAIAPANAVAAPPLTALPPPPTRSGKKYKGLLAKREAEQAVSAHAQFLSPSINFE